MVEGDVSGERIKSSVGIHSHCPSLSPSPSLSLSLSTETQVLCSFQRRRREGVSAGSVKLGCLSRRRKYGYLPRTKQLHL